MEMLWGLVAVIHLPMCSCTHTRTQNCRQVQLIFSTVPLQDWGSGGGELRWAEHAETLSCTHYPTPHPPTYLHTHIWVSEEPIWLPANEEKRWWTGRTKLGKVNTIQERWQVQSLCMCAHMCVSACVLQDVSMSRKMKPKWLDLWVSLLIKWCESVCVLHNAISHSKRKLK